MNAEPDKNSAGERCTPDRLLHSGAESGQVSAEDLVLASGRDINPRNLAWAERKLAEKGPAALDELLP